MVIQHNMRSLNADRMLSINSAQLAGTTEKLVSGYKINRAADDAAGLSISEKMRKRIRGLERGMENVEDGISLCQVADGALNEVTELIQRMRELSIQAYNGTNSKSDRHTIQEEIDQSIKELDRTFETTKFNEIYIFRNGTRVKGTAFNPEEYTVRRSVTSYRSMPDWLEINDGSDNKIGIHTSYLNGTTQDGKGIMQQDFKLKSGTVKLYFGENKGTVEGYQWVGNFIKNKNTAAYKELMQDSDFKKYIDGHTDRNGNYTGWTDTLDDNVSAKFSFEKLTEATDASDLYNKLGQLVGAEIGFPCGSCTRMEAIRFSGTFNGMDNLNFQDASPSYVAKSNINLSTKSFTWQGKDYTGYFDAVTDIMAIDDPTLNVADLTKDLAETIAKDLAGSTFDALNKAMTTHYDRAYMDGQNDPYSVYIYDYRDTDVIKLTSKYSDGYTTGSVDTTIRTSSRVSFQYDETITTGYYTHYDYWDGNQIWIQASDETPDGLSILDRRLSAESLGLSGYRVDTYKTKVEMDDPEGYQKKLAAWNAAAPKPEIVYETKKVQTTVMIQPPVYEYKYVNGEKKSILVSQGKYETKWEDRQVAKYIYPNDTRGPKPTPTFTVHEIYNPSKLELLDDALATITKVRSYFGAVQNRLEHTYDNNNNAHENMTYAESQIRDTDMAEETVRNSVLNILQQAGLSMLAQSNQSNQGVSMLLAS